MRVLVLGMVQKLTVSMVYKCHLFPTYLLLYTCLNQAKDKGYKFEWCIDEAGSKYFLPNHCIQTLLNCHRILKHFISIYTSFIVITIWALSSKMNQSYGGEDKNKAGGK